MLGNTIASIKSAFGTKLGFFLVRFLLLPAGSDFLAKVFRNDYLAPCSTARRSATEKNEIGGHVTVTCLSKMTQHNSTADWLKF